MPDKQDRSTVVLCGSNKLQSDACGGPSGATERDSARGCCEAAAEGKAERGRELSEKWSSRTVAPLSMTESDTEQ